ncbi:excalibur calcium-binding domain-containing protein [Ruegeria sp. R14_0]|uniref:excalibur calcium-binding domain-containing protein n=1 Tax=Ruegeria sp. R14_0 TaxID=2821100 RepID=UPI001ADD4A59|nr:excalibur calcium-binding domain-containing protein [Ruegeria sp. R14_0]MBO9445505.1 excalibur calcium-binding domain-containing protein [Ruegeria sp. R14_0]
MEHNDPDLDRPKKCTRTSARHRRADAQRRRALSPVRIILMLLMLPATTAAIAVGVYLRTSEFESHEALLHLIAMVSCDTAGSLVPGPYREGEPGYHARNDLDGDGVACGTIAPVAATPQSAEAPQSPQPAEAQQSRQLGTAKFVRP